MNGLESDYYTQVPRYLKEIAQQLKKNNEPNGEKELLEALRANQEILRNIMNRDINGDKPLGKGCLASLITANNFLISKYE